MNRILAILAAISIALCFCLPVTAASYRDDCADVLDDHVREYDGFSNNIPDFIGFSGWSGCGDRSVITVDSREALATYRIDGAQRVQIQLFSSQATFAVPSNDSYRMSVRSSEELGQARRCYYDRSQDIVFLRENGKTYSLRNERRGLMLREDSSALRSDCFYGLNVFVSSDGISYQPMDDVKLEKIESQYLEEGTGVFVRETYSVGLPSSASYVRLAFVECSRIPGGGTVDVIDRSNLHFLSKVTFEGGALEPGGSSESENSLSEPDDSSPSDAKSGGASAMDSSSEPAENSSDAENSTSMPEVTSSVPQISSSEPEDSDSNPENVPAGSKGESSGKGSSKSPITNKPVSGISTSKTVDARYIESVPKTHANEAPPAVASEAPQPDYTPLSDSSKGDDAGIAVHRNFSDGPAERALIPERTLYHGSVGGAGAALVIVGALKNLRR